MGLPSRDGFPASLPRPIEPKRSVGPPGHCEAVFVRFLDKCSVCGEPQTTDYPAGLFQWVELDLDLKATGDVGWLWPENSVRCITCGACGVTIWGFPEGTLDAVNSPEYRAVADGPWPEGYRNEMAAALLGEMLGSPDAAFERYLVASWIAEDAQSWLGGDDPEWVGLADLARQKAVAAWIAEAGDPTAGPLPRCTELAATHVIGHPLLDNQVLVDLLRRLGEWDRAAAAAANARRALADTLAAWGGYDELPNDEERDIVRACELALDLEDALIAHRDSSRAGARLDLPLWFADQI